MRTVRCSGRLLGGGGVWLWVSGRGGCLPRGCLAGGCLSGGGCLPDIHRLWTESQTGVKTLTCRIYVADGNECHQIRVKYRVREHGRAQVQVYWKFNESLIVNQMVQTLHASANILHVCIHTNISNFTKF